MLRGYLITTLAALPALVLLTSCGDNDGTIPTQRFDFGAGVYVCNEGQYSVKDGSITFYDGSAAAQNNVYYRANGTPLGGGCQAMSIIDGKGYIAMMEEGKVLVVNPATMKNIGTVTGLATPAYVIDAGASKIYVADKYLNQLSVVNKDTYAVTGTIVLGTVAAGDARPSRSAAPVAPAASRQAATRSVVSGDYVYIYNWVNSDWSVGSEIFRVDRTTDTYVDAVTVTKGPNSVAIDTNDVLWVLSDGRDYTGGDTNAALTKIDLSTFSITGDPLIFSDITATPARLAINGAGDRLYYIGKNRGEDYYDVSSGVYTLGIDAQALPFSPHIPDTNGTFYGLGVDPSSGDIYIGDMMSIYDAVPGKIYRYSSDGAQRTAAFDAGMYPGSFCFRQ